MTLEQVNEILKSNFADEEDRRYWEDKKAELERKESAMANNEQYRRKMIKYNR